MKTKNIKYILKSDILDINIDYQVMHPNYSYTDVLNEAVKCHHNEIANYFLPYQTPKIDPLKYLALKNEYSSDEEVGECAIHRYYYAFSPDDFKQNNVFYCLCKYHHQTHVNLYIDKYKSDIEAKKVLRFFLNGISTKNILMIFMILF